MNTGYIFVIEGKNGIKYIASFYSDYSVGIYLDWDWDIFTEIKEVNIFRPMNKKVIASILKEMFLDLEENEEIYIQKEYI